MLEYDLTHFGFERKNPLARNVPGPWRAWPARAVDHAGPRQWLRDAYGRLYSVSAQQPAERGR